MGLGEAGSIAHNFGHTRTLHRDCADCDVPIRIAPDAGAVGTQTVLWDQPFGEARGHAGDFAGGHAPGRLPIPRHPQRLDRTGIIGGCYSTKYNFLNELKSGDNIIIILITIKYKYLKTYKFIQII